MKDHPVKFIVILAFLVAFLGLLGCSAFLDAHKDPFYYATCPLCKWQIEFSAILFCIVTSISVLLVVSRKLSHELNPPVFKRLYFAFYRLRAPPFAPLA
jgi:hypothetical protein